MVFAFITPQHHLLSNHYGILFHFLAYSTSRNEYCHLLFLLTRREHVTGYRIQILLELHKSSMSDNALIALLGLFKEYIPDALVGKFKPQQKNVFSHPDSHWLEVTQRMRDGNVSISSSIKTNRRLIEDSRNAKRHKLATSIPATQNFESAASDILLKDLKELDLIVKHVAEVKLPSQFGAVLSDPTFREVLWYRMDRTILSRLNFWLESFISSIELDDSNHTLSSSDFENIFSRLCIVSSSFWQIPQSIERVILSTFKYILPLRGCPSFLRLASFLPPRSVTDFSDMVVTPIRNTAHQLTADEITLLLHEFICPLLTRLSTFYSHERANDDEKLRTKFTLEVPTTRGVLTDAFLDEIAFCVNTLCNSSLHNNSTTALLRAFLDTYEILISLTTKHKIIHINLPSHRLIYRCIFSGQAEVISRLAGLMRTYKMAYEIYEKAGEDAGVVYTRESINHFNSYVMDMCNCLWRNRAFNLQDSNATGLGIPPDIIEAMKTDADRREMSPLGSLFGVISGESFSRYALDYLRTKEDESLDITVRHVGPPTTHSMQQLALVCDPLLCSPY